MTLHVSSEKTNLSTDIFRRIANVPLLDKYEAYQLLDNEWQSILIDLEILQTEGFDAVKQVDANMVTKKGKVEDTEVQEGWKGHVLPFELVQKVHLSSELQSLTDKENRVAEITAEYEELLDALSEEIKDSAITNDAKDAFMNAEVVKLAKEITAEKKKGATYGEEDDETKILKVSALIAEEKTLKKDIKEEAEALHSLTKKTIETLTDDEAKVLLERKWITPLVKALHSLPNNKIATLTQKVSYLAGKYITTLQDLSQQLQKTEEVLVELMGELTGSDHDIEGLNEWKKLLKSEESDKR
jgi:type I restriction enzyme M protein